MLLSLARVAVNRWLVGLLVRLDGQQRAQRLLRVKPVQAHPLVRITPSYTLVIHKPSTFATSCYAGSHNRKWEALPMPAAEAAVRHLKAAREEFARERSQIDRHIHELDVMIARFEASPGSTSETTRPVPTLETTSVTPRVIVTDPNDDHRPSMKEAILTVLSQADENTMASSAIEDQLGDRYGWGGASVRSQLLKMLNANDLVRPARGIYRLALPMNTEGPASAGPSDDATAIGREGGVGTHVETADIRDHGYPDQGEDRDHDRGASVVGG